MQMRSDRWNGTKPLAMDARTLCLCSKSTPLAVFCYYSTRKVPEIRINEFISQAKNQIRITIQNSTPKKSN